MGYLQQLFKPTIEQIHAIVRRNAKQHTNVSKQVISLIKQVQQGQDEALLHLCRLYDSPSLSSVVVPKKAIADASEAVEPALKEAIKRAKRNIETFHKAQIPKDEKVETEKGLWCWRKSVPLQRVGLYIPGGSAPLFSTVLMLGVPAKIAGCPSIALATPAQKDGSVHPATLYAASLCGIDEIYAMGGAQAIAALAYGTQSIANVDKIFGPGNRYVTEAKMHVSSTCSIDMPAGPSEVMVVIDKKSNLQYAAADLLSQAEHGSDSQVVALIYCSDNQEAMSIIAALENELTIQLGALSRKEIAAKSLQKSWVLTTSSVSEAAHLINAYAPEHLLLQTAFNEELVSLITHAGSVFVGPYACEALGDYASGTNHTLPTDGWARSVGGVSVDSFYKKITFQSATRQALHSLGPSVMLMAQKERLDAHAAAVKVRLEKGKED
ncbi:MAG: histidinol dehydrogenase [Sphaerochaetaceae bacterium]